MSCYRSLKVMFSGQRKWVWVEENWDAGATNRKGYTAEKPCAKQKQAETAMVVFWFCWWHSLLLRLFKAVQNSSTAVPDQTSSTTANLKLCGKPNLIGPAFKGLLFQLQLLGKQHCWAPVSRGLDGEIGCPHGWHWGSSLKGRTRDFSSICPLVRIVMCFTPTLLFART